MDLAQRLLRIAGMNVPTCTKSNEQRLRELEVQGLRLEVADSHGVNNCLIDSLLQGMMHRGLAPKTLTLEQRRVLCEECGAHLCDEYGVARGVYLDGHRDIPRILNYFLRLRWQQDVSVRVRLYDALAHGELGEAAQELDFVDFTWGDRVVYERVMLHIYNHTVPSGQGYYFDALLPCAEPNGQGKATMERSTTQDVTLETPLFSEKRESKSTPYTSCSSSSQTTTSEAEMQMLLQDFFDARGCRVTVGERDAREVLAAWFNREALGLKLHTLLQAGTIYADSGWHASNRLVDQWFGYHAVRSQGGGQRLGDSRPCAGVEPPDSKAKRASKREFPGAEHEQGKAEQKRKAPTWPMESFAAGAENGLPKNTSPSRETAACATKSPKQAFAPNPKRMPRAARVPPLKRLRQKTTVMQTDSFSGKVQQITGIPLGRQLLLDVWRQEPINWEALKAKYIEEKLCNECGERKRKTAFTKAQWQNSRHVVCKECTTKKREEQTPFRCTQCGIWHAASHFSVQQRNPRVTASRVCLTCEVTKLCYVCRKQLPRDHFTTGAWKVYTMQIAEAVWAVEKRCLDTGRAAHAAKDCQKVAFPTSFVHVYRAKTGGNNVMSVVAAGSSAGSVRQLPPVATIDWQG
eukprot:Skav211300  [mRNA]  locus=scaffold1052:123014:131837:- [translate_table: standard]